MKKNDRISALCKAAEAMARGDLTLDIPIGDDEIGHLGKSLKKLSAYLKKQSERSQSLYRIMVECNLNLQLIDILNHIYEFFQDHLPYDRISLALLENEGNKLKLHWSRANYDKQELIAGLSIPMSDSGLRAIIDINEMLIIDDLTAHLEKQLLKKAFAPASFALWLPLEKRLDLFSFLVAKKAFTKTCIRIYPCKSPANWRSSLRKPNYIKE